MTAKHSTNETTITLETQIAWKHREQAYLVALSSMRVTALHEGHLQSMLFLLSTAAIASA
jgi:hypothetical protein